MTQAQLNKLAQDDAHLARKIARATRREAGSRATRRARRDVLNALRDEAL